MTTIKHILAILLGLPASRQIVAECDKCGGLRVITWRWRHWGKRCGECNGKSESKKQKRG